VTSGPCEVLHIQRYEPHPELLLWKNCAQYATAHTFKLCSSRNRRSMGESIQRYQRRCSFHHVCGISVTRLTANGCVVITRLSLHLISRTPPLSPQHQRHNLTTPSYGLSLRRQDLRSSFDRPSHLNRKSRLGGQLSPTNSTAHVLQINPNQVKDAPISQKPSSTKWRSVRTLQRDERYTTGDSRSRRSRGRHR